MSVVGRYFLKVLPIIVIAMIVFVFQLIPEGQTIAKGDFYWLFNIGDHYSRYWYMWIDQTGQGAFNVLNPAGLYYLVLGLVDNLGVAYLANWMMFLWLLGSYYSFYYLCGVIYPKFISNTKLLASLLYALNFFVITIFSYSWGLNHHFLIYPFIPLLLAGFYQVFFYDHFSLRKIILFLIYFILSTVSYNNIARFFLVFLFLLIMLFIGIIQKNILLNKNFLLKIWIIFLGIMVLFGLYLMVFYIGNSDLISKISSNAVLGSDLSGWIRATSNTFLESFLLIMGERYPHKNPLMIVGQICILGAMLYFFFFSSKKFKMGSMWFMIFLALVFLTVRYVDEYSEFYLRLYQLPGFNLFRSPDKIFVLLPLIFCLFIAPIVNKYKYVGISLLIISLAPWFTKDIFTINEDQNDKYKMLVQIPKEYKNISLLVNQPKKTTAIISLPYSVVNSINRSQYPMRNFMGHDILHLFYNRRYLSANSYDHPSYETKLSRKDINEDLGATENDLLNNIIKFGGEYVIYHKDIEQFQIDANRNIESLIKNSDQLSLLTGNDYFDLYELDKKYVRTILSLNNNGNQDYIVIEKINPTKYSLNLTVLPSSTGEELSFLQSFHNERKLYPGYPINTGDCERMEYYSGSQDQFDVKSGNSIVFSGDSYILTHTTTTGESFRSILSRYGYTVDQLYQYNSTVSLYPALSEELQITIPDDLVASGSMIDQMVSERQGSGLMTRGPTTECVRDGYTFFQGEELSYLWRKPLWDDTHKMVYDYANGRSINLGSPLGKGDDEDVGIGGGTYLEQGLREGRITQNADGSYNVSLTLYFRPQSRFYLGLLISGTTFLWLIGRLIRDWRTKQKSSQKQL